MWQRRSFVGLPLLAALVATIALTPPARAQGDNLRVEVTQVDGGRFPLVTIYVSVTDTHGQPAVGLDQSDLTIAEDGQVVEIVEFKGSGGSPVNTMLVLDRSGSMQGQKLSGAQQAAHTFVELMRPQDQVGLLLFAGTAELAQSLTSDKAALQRSIDAIQLANDTALYDAVLQGLDLLHPISGRKSAIVLSDGMDNRDHWLAGLTGYGSTHTLEETVMQASTSGVTLYTIGLGERNELNEPALRQLADRTGGVYYHTPSADQLAALYRSLSQQLQTEYAITYRSPRAAYDGTRRGIQITVNASGGQTGSSSGGYLERHLLQLRVRPLPGLVLFGLLLVALMVPLAVHSRRASAADLPPTILPRRSPDPPEARELREPSVMVKPPDRTCRFCGAGLRATAQFCAGCGQRQL